MNTFDLCPFFVDPFSIRTWDSLLNMSESPWKVGPRVSSEAYLTGIRPYIFHASSQLDGKEASRSPGCRPPSPDKISLLLLGRRRCTGYYGICYGRTIFLFHFFQNKWATVGNR